MAAMITSLVIISLFIIIPSVLMVNAIISIIIIFPKLKGYNTMIDGNILSANKIDSGNWVINVETIQNEETVIITEVVSEKLLNRLRSTPVIRVMCDKEFTKFTTDSFMVRRLVRSIMAGIPSVFLLMHVIRAYIIGLL